MGRPKQHDAQTAAALLDAAEQIAGEHGLTAVSVRGVADRVDTTTRAIYSLFGSKEGLIAAMGARTWDLLAATVQALPLTEDAAADLVAAGLRGFRALVLEHPALFQLGVQQLGATPEQTLEIRAAAARAWTVLQARVLRVHEQVGLGPHAVDEVATSFHALCEGLAALETRDLFPAAQAEYIWRSALTALIDGYCIEAT